MRNPSTLNSAKVQLGYHLSLILFLKEISRDKFTV
jgi:hypothetical protein